MTNCLDEAYAILEETAPEYGPLGLSNHGPMAVEALAALGREDAILPWLDNYARHLDPRRPSRQPVDPGDWQGLLGHVDRHADLAAFFSAELAKASWEEVVGEWARRLAPGLAGGALHGLLRACHAVRAIRQEDNALRRQELAQGLAYWAACYTKLPGDADGSGRQQAAAALAGVALLPQEQRSEHGLITVALVALATFPPFPAVVNAIDVGSRPAPEILSDLTETFANVYLANATPTNLIALIHMVTGPSAVRLLLPLVDETTAQHLLAYAWQAGCALYSAFATTHVRPQIAQPPPVADELIDRAIDNGDEHAIKFTEACLREEAVRPLPIFRAAADDVIRRTPKA